MVTDNPATIISTIKSTPVPIIVLDDFQYVMANAFMMRAQEKGYEKFTEIGQSAWKILRTATEVGQGKRIYILSHVASSEDGTIRMKTIGRMLDDKIVPEGMVPICLRAMVIDGKHVFSTRNSGSDTAKAPIGMFDEDVIDNDLAKVDQAICTYYEIGG